MTALRRIVARIRRAVARRLRREGPPKVVVAAPDDAVARRPGRGADLVLVEPGVALPAGALDALQAAAYAPDDALRGAVAARELRSDGTVRATGLYHDPREPGSLHERFSGRPADDPAASAASPVLAASGACLYLRNDALEAAGIGPNDDATEICLRLWRAGRRVVAWPAVTVTRRGDEPPASLSERWAAWLEERQVRTPTGALRIVYVTRDTGIGGGHRVVFEHVNGLVDRGHEVEVWSLEGAPDWFELRAPVRTFESFGPLEAALDPLEAIKVATWWETNQPVWLSSVRHGIGAAFVQDIETSYYPNDEWHHGTILSSYRDEFRMLTTSSFNRERLEAMGLHPDVVAPGIDRDVFRELPEVQRRSDLVLALGRSQPLKNLPVTLAAAREVDGAELVLFGSEPDLGEQHGVRYVARPSDEEVNHLLNEAAVFVQTSTHEGFCLPPLEAMAAGCPVVCTDAGGNRDFCRDGVNCLMPEPTAEAVAVAIRRMLTDHELRAQLVQAGRRTAAEYGWPERVDVLERCFEGMADYPARACRTTSER